MGREGKGVSFQDVARNVLSQQLPKHLALSEVPKYLAIKTEYMWNANQKETKKYLVSDVYSSIIKLLSYKHIYFFLKYFTYIRMKCK